MARMTDPTLDTLSNIPVPPSALGKCPHQRRAEAPQGAFRRIPNPPNPPIGYPDAMPNYLRYRVPGGTYFFTINLLDRGADHLTRHIDALRAAVRRTRNERPFHIDAWIVLPEHMHCVITLPEDDSDFSNRIKAIKIRFVRALPPTEHCSPVRAARGERGIWQRRFWEHAIRDQHD